jgi:hypothetical protein
MQALFAFCLGTRHQPARRQQQFGILFTKVPRVNEGRSLLVVGGWQELAPASTSHIEIA